MVGMPPPPDGGGGLGLRPDHSEAKEGEGQRAERGGASSSELEFRNKYNTGGARVPVAVVLFHDDYSPPSGVYYFRQGAFSQYNGRKLVVSGRQDIDDRSDPVLSHPTHRDRKRAARSTRIAGPLETTIALMADHTQPFALERRSRSSRSRTRRRIDSVASTARCPVCSPPTTLRCSTHAGFSGLVQGAVGALHRGTARSALRRAGDRGHRGAA